MRDLGRPTAPQPDSSSPAAEASVRNAQTQAGTPAPARERRKPRISETPPAAPPAPRLADYESIIGKSQLDELRFVASPLRGKREQQVNSPATAGRVAELLHRLVHVL